MDSKEKIEKFLKAYGELVEKHGVDFANYPVFIPDDNGAFKIMIRTTPVDLEAQKEAKRKQFMAKNV